MTAPEDDVTVAEALAHHDGYAGRYDGRWFELGFGPVTFSLPNSPSRAWVAERHDVHHVATGYGADPVGEAELAAWELGSGCGSHPAAWIVNVAALPLGVAVAPLRTLAAFQRGRRSRNLYNGDVEPKELRDAPLGEVRARLGLADDRGGPRLDPADAVGLGVHAAAGVAAGSVVAATGLLFSVLRRLAGDGGDDQDDRDSPEERDR